ncbi:MAG: hypothetical protein KDB14_31410, partial [Planctomycetales bacterium]|nr:hypothetical protein [Planctomycetales bacterium]
MSSPHEPEPTRTDASSAGDRGTGSLRDRAAREVAARLADLHHSHLPLPEGLRAAAAEAKRRDV